MNEMCLSIQISLVVFVSRTSTKVFSPQKSIGTGALVFPSITPRIVDHGSTRVHIHYLKWHSLPGNDRHRLLFILFLCRVEAQNWLLLLRRY